MTDTDTAELVAKLRASGTRSAKGDGVYMSICDQAADRLTALERELGEARTLNNKYAWERDKAREERDAAERRSEAFWKPQLTASQAEVERLTLELEAADHFGGGWFSPLVSEDVKEGYRILVRERAALQPQVGK